MNNDDFHLYEALGRRVSGRLPTAAWRQLFTAQGGAGVRTERRTLTLLYVDRGEAEAAVALHGDALESELEWLAARHHGIRDRFSPAGALVFFDDAMSCVRMAMALQRATAPLRLRIGISTASCQIATFCSGGEAFTTLLGAEAELAAKVAGDASSGSILISPSTYALVRDAVHADSRDCLLAEEFDGSCFSAATLMPTPTRGGPEASTFAGLGTF
jgi:class 3 adenylate cyclase